jgi:hypothetical protein
LSRRSRTPLGVSVRWVLFRLVDGWPIYPPWCDTGWAVWACIPFTVMMAATIGVRSVSRRAFFRIDGGSVMAVPLGGKPPVSG